MDEQTERADRRLWIAALACFVVAGATGALFRSGLAMGFSLGPALGLSPEHIRHAHSHLMMFSWVTPVLFLMIGRTVARSDEDHIRFRRTAWWALVLGVVAFPLFLVYGYGLARIGSADLPLAAMASGLNMLVWYVFAAYYVQSTHGRVRDRMLRMWDTAVTFLVLSSFGAWGISAVTMAGVESMRWPVALTHLFLEYFTLGWLAAAVVGLWYMKKRRGSNRSWNTDTPATTATEDPEAAAATEAAAAPEVAAAPEQTGNRLFAVALVLFLIGTALSYIAGMPRSLVPDGLVLPARMAGMMVGVALVLFFVDSVERTDSGWRISRWMALFLGGGLVVFSGIPGTWWADVHPLRILYIHIVLLGIVSTALVGGIVRPTGDVRAARLFHGSVVLLIGTLVTMTHLWPMAWRGAWVFDAVFAGALLPVVAAVVVLVRLIATVFPSG